MCKSHVRNYLVQLSLMAGEDAGRNTGYQRGDYRRRRNRCNLVPGTVKRNPTLFLHKQYICVQMCVTVCVCVCEQESQLKSENIFPPHTHTYTEIKTEVFPKLLELIFWRLSTKAN